MENDTLFIIGLGLIVGFFFIFRFVMLWYWRIDTIIENQEKTNRLLSRILDKIKEIDK
jgi:hypothetical protein